MNEARAEIEEPSSRYPWVIGRARGATIILVDSPAMLQGYVFELKKAAEEFVKRVNAREGLTYGGEPIRTEEVLDHLYELARDRGGLWIVVDELYRLLGFLGAIISETPLGHRRIAAVTVYYLWPKRMNLSISPVLNPMLDAWAVANGATRIVHTSGKRTPRAWRRLGYAEVGRVYAKPLGEVEE